MSTSATGASTIRIGRISRVGRQTSSSVGVWKYRARASTSATFIISDGWRVIHAQVDPALGAHADLAHHLDRHKQDESDAVERIGEPEPDSHGRPGRLTIIMPSAHAEADAVAHRPGFERAVRRGIEHRHADAGDHPEQQRTREPSSAGSASRRGSSPGRPPRTRRAAEAAEQLGAAAVVAVVARAHPASSSPDIGDGGRIGIRGPSESVSGGQRRLPVRPVAGPARASGPPTGDLGRSGRATAEPPPPCSTTHRRHRSAGLCNLGRESPTNRA